MKPKATVGLDENWMTGSTTEPDSGRVQNQANVRLLDFESTYNNLQCNRLRSLWNLYSMITNPLYDRSFIYRSLCWNVQPSARLWISPLAKLTPTNLSQSIVKLTSFAVLAINAEGAPTVDQSAWMESLGPAASKCTKLTTWSTSELLQSEGPHPGLIEWVTSRVKQDARVKDDRTNIGNSSCIVISDRVCQAQICNKVQLLCPPMFTTINTVHYNYKFH